jgi:hypothetical protein
VSARGSPETPRASSIYTLTKATNRFGRGRVGASQVGGSGERRAPSGADRERDVHVFDVPRRVTSSTIPIHSHEANPSANISHGPCFHPERNRAGLCAHGVRTKTVRVVSRLAERGWRRGPVHLASHQTERAWRRLPGEIQRRVSRGSEVMASRRRFDPGTRWRKQRRATIRRHGAARYLRSRAVRRRRCPRRPVVAPAAAAGTRARCSSAPRG